MSSTLPGNLTLAFCRVQHVNSCVLQDPSRFPGILVTAADLIAVSRGDRPADVVFAGGTVVNVHSGELERIDLAVAGSRVAALGAGYDAVRTIVRTLLVEAAT